MKKIIVILLTTIIVLTGCSGFTGNTKNNMISGTPETLTLPSGYAEIVTVSHERVGYHDTYFYEAINNDWLKLYSVFNPGIVYVQSQNVIIKQISDCPLQDALEVVGEYDEYEQRNRYHFYSSPDAEKEQQEICSSYFSKEELLAGDLR